MLAFFKVGQGATKHGYAKEYLVFSSKIFSMDTQVIAAMAKWPNVPAVRGWLRLDRRGKWYLIDRGAPGFDETLHGKGSPITSPPICDFIERNYTVDEFGEWFWQNGPQRAYVSYDIAPLVLRVMSDKKNSEKKSLITHCGDLVTSITKVLADEAGNVLIDSEWGRGVVHDMDASQLDIHESADGNLQLRWQGVDIAFSNQ
jgi:Protein of unknown function (DUF2946)